MISPQTIQIRMKTITDIHDLYKKNYAESKKSFKSISWVYLFYIYLAISLSPYYLIGIFCISIPPLYYWNHSRRLLRRHEKSLYEVRVLISLATLSILPPMPIAEAFIKKTDQMLRINI